MARANEKWLAGRDPDAYGRRSLDSIHRVEIRRKMDPEIQTVRTTPGPTSVSTKQGIQSLADLLPPSPIGVPRLSKQSGQVPVSQRGSQSLLKQPRSPAIGETLRLCQGCAQRRARRRCRRPEIWRD